MFKELTKQYTPLPFGDNVLFLRYDNAALLQLERAGIDILQIKLNDNTAANWILSGLRSYFDEFATPEAEQVDKVVQIIKMTDAIQLFNNIYNAIKLALPESPESDAPKPGSNNSLSTDLSPLYSRFCDIMGKSDSEFWSLTLREVIERWNAYAEFMGYKRPMTEVAEFDDED